ncbi:MAG TPA: hypothetical protein VNO26_05350 [Candidatus Limnocylindria bacterium]|nr:hypothetical protein [Candidatus Limnocylindria bacterium]
MHADVGDGSQFEKRRQLLKRVIELLDARGGVTDGCQACITRQFQRRLPIEEQLPCRERLQGIGGFPNGTEEDRPVAGAKLLLTATASKERLSFLSKDAGVAAPLVNTPSDPTLFGASVELCTAEGTVVFDLPADHWRVSRSGSVYKFKRPGRPADVKMAVIQRGRKLKVSSNAVGVPLGGGLGPVGVRVGTGTVRNCAFFPSTTIVTDAPGRFLAEDAAAGAALDCGNEALGCAAVP